MANNGSGTNNPSNNSSSLMQVNNNTRDIHNTNSSDQKYQGADNSKTMENVSTKYTFDH